MKTHKHTHIQRPTHALQLPAMFLQWRKTRDYCGSWCYLPKIWNGTVQSVIVIWKKHAGKTPFIQISELRVARMNKTESCCIKHSAISAKHWLKCLMNTQSQRYLTRKLVCANKTASECINLQMSPVLFQFKLPSFLAASTLTLFRQTM